MEGEALSGIGFAKALTEEVRQSPDPINDGIKGRACLGRKPDVFDPGSNLFADFRRLLLAIVLVDLGQGALPIGTTDPWCIVRLPDGRLCGASDPRKDGIALAVDRQ